MNGEIMIKVNTTILKVIFLFTMGLIINAPGGQFYFLDGTFTWSADCCSPGDMPWNSPPESNWLTPDNYYEGGFYQRTEILEKPSNLPVNAWLCIWQDDYSRETCGGRDSGQGLWYADTGVFYVMPGPPEEWWKKNDIGVDWTRPFNQVQLVTRDLDYDKLLTRNAGEASYPGNDLDEHVPIKHKTQIIAVSRDSEFEPPEDWEDCPVEWGCESAMQTKNRNRFAVDRMAVHSCIVEYTAEGILFRTGKDVRQIEVLQLNGFRVYQSSLFNGSGAENSIYWNKSDRNGNTVKTGVYILKMIAADKCIYHNFMVL
jgi:hypothetical protein